MMTTTKIQEISISDCGLSPRMTPSEVITAKNNLRSKLGHEYYDKTEELVLFNLKQIPPKKVFHFTKHFFGDELKVFLVTAFLFIIEHWHYDLSSDYTKIRRKK